MNSSSVDKRGLDWYLWLGMVLFTASMMFSIALVQTVVVLLTGLWIVKILRGGYRFRRTPLDVPVAAFVLARLISIALSVNPSVSMQSLYTEVYYYVVFFIFTNELPVHDKGKMRLMVLLMITCAVVASVIGGFKTLIGMTPRAASTTSGYYTLGMYLVAGLAMALLLGGSKEFFSRRWVWGVTCAIIAFGIVLTFNRLHWAVMALLVVLVGLVWERRLLVGFVVAGIASVTLVPEVGLRLSGVTDLTALTTGRDVIWRGAWMMAGEHPFFGFGPRTFHEIFPLMAEMADKNVGTWHNDFLQVYMESGLLGLGTYLWLIWTVMYVGIKGYRKLSAEPFYRHILGAVLLAVASIVVGGMGGIFVTDPIVSLLFKQLIAVVALLSVMAERGEPINVVASPTQEVSPRGS